MKVEIRRNRTLSWHCELTGDDRHMMELVNGFQKLTPEQQALIDERERVRHEIEEKIWADIESRQPVYDLLGDPISRETHEICFDVYHYKDENGLAYMAAKAIYIQPKKSEYEKEG